MPSSIVIYCILGLVSRIESWTPEITPKLYIKYGELRLILRAWNPSLYGLGKKSYFIRFLDQEKLPIFYGNVTDYFKLLDQDETTILIGARYVLYLSLVVCIAIYFLSLP